jgi:hypothetical protein
MPEPATRKTQGSVGSGEGEDEGSPVLERLGDQWRRSSKSGGRAVVTSSGGESASVGVSDRGALLPTEIECVSARTSIEPTPWMSLPSGSATSQ